MAVHKPMGDITYATAIIYTVYGVTPCMATRHLIQHITVTVSPVCAGEPISYSTLI